MGRGSSVPRPLKRGGKQVKEGKQPVWRLRVVDRLGHQLERRFVGSYEDAVIALSDLRKQVQATSLSVPNQFATVLQAATAWLEAHKWSIPPTKKQEGERKRPSGISKHSSILNAYLIPALGADTKVRRVTLDDLLEAVADATRKDGELVSPTTKATIASTARQMFKWLKRNGWILTNPAEDLPTNWGASGRVREAIPTVTEVEQIAKALDKLDSNIRYGDAYRLMARTGLRYSEMVGLKKVNVHVLRNPHIIVTETIVSSGGRKVEYKATKTQAGQRQVPLTVEAVGIIRRLMKDSDAKESPYVVAAARGGSLSTSMWNRALAQVRKSHPDWVVYSAHYLRHLFCSMAIAAGRTDEEVQKLAGHSSITVTRGTYGHLLAMDQTELRAALEKAYSSLEAAAADEEE